MPIFRGNRCHEICPSENIFCTETSNIHNRNGGCNSTAKKKTNKKRKLKSGLS